MDIAYARIPIRRIKINPLNTRTHSRKQIERLQASMKAAGFLAPIIADEEQRDDRRSTGVDFGDHLRE